MIKFILNFLFNFSLYHSGEIKQICYTDHTRTSTLNVPQEKVAVYYKALAKFLEYVYSADALLQFKLQPGTMMAFDNYRILHGRTAFNVLPGSKRHFEGTFLDWDNVLSYMRVFERDHHINDKTPSM